MKFEFRAFDTKECTMIYDIQKRPNMYHYFNDKRFHIMLFSGHVNHQGKKLYQGDILISNEEDCDSIREIIFENGIFKNKWISEEDREECYSTISDVTLKYFNLLGNKYEDIDLKKEKYLFLKNRIKKLKNNF